MKKNSLIISVCASLLVCFGAFFGVIIQGKAPILGLDLRGGADFLYCPTDLHDAKKCAPAGSVSSAKLNEVVQILQDRVGSIGVVQPNISVQGGDVDVQVPGHVNRTTLINIIGNTSNLYFRKIICLANPYVPPSKSTTTTSSTSSTTSTSVPKVSGKGSSTTTSSTAATTSTTAAKSSTTTTPKGSTTTTTVPKSTTTTTTVPSHYNAGYTPPPACPAAYTTTSAIQGGQVWTGLDNYPTNTQAEDLGNPHEPMVLPLTISSSSGVANSSLGRAEVGPVQASASILGGASSEVGTSGDVVLFSFKGGSGLNAWNKDVAGPDYQGMIADDLSGQIVSYAENTSQTYTSTGGQLTGLNQSQVQQITLLLQYGALPVGIQPLSQTSISPTLGAASLQAGIFAGLVGMFLVMLYMIWYYRALGLVVVLGLASTGALIYAIISAAKLTLDLSGVIGLIVAIGITVDSYVVYFERLKDEVRAGRSIRSSVDRGFKSAFRTIVAADLVSLIGAVVLYFLSIGAVKNFAFMLLISTVLDVLSAYFFTRPLVILLGRNRIFPEARYFGVARGLAAAGAEAGA